MSYQTLKVQIEAQTCIVTISRPEALNALNSQVLDELGFVLKEISQKQFSEIRALIITGQGEKAFVAGADIKEINSLSPAQATVFAEKGQKVFRDLEKLKIPVIAAVNGFSLGGGCELALACDFIYASENAKFGLPEVSLGLIPGFGGTVRLARVVGPNRAKELISTGELISASEALRIGVVNKVFSLPELMPAVLKTTALVSTRAPVAVASAKESILQCYDVDVDAAMKLEAKHFAKLFETKDVQEGTKAFLEKRKPNFTGM